jgi:dihydropteroate synthase
MIDLSTPRVMGIINATPDSFSDGGRYDGAAAAIAHCERLVAEGADILDIGGESSRPGAEEVPADEEWRRVAPVLKAALSLGVPVSIDTYKAETMRAALELGVDIVNDIQALRRPGALAAVAAHSGAGVCLMHMRGEPLTMKEQARYDDVVAEVRGFLSWRSAEVQAAGIAAGRIVLDPGIGFAKLHEHNIELLTGQRVLADTLDRPLLVGWSRKSTLGKVTGRDTPDRLVASVAAALACVAHGARIVRVHDVAATVDALKVWQVASRGRAAG